jgi:superfamily II DNA or RNA helicase
MQMALDNNWLTHYKYYPHIVELDDDEFKKYIEFSRKLMKYFDASTGKYKDVPEVEALLLARKRIIHKAKNKITAFRKILEDEYNNRGDLKYTLVYVPEGMDPDYTIVDEQDETEDDMRLINQYTREVSDVNFDVMVKQYVSQSKNKEAVLDDFASGKLDVLTSMKCLDEGVDVPRSELAIFCSSTGNPRQFIQRRGRVLRLADGKNMATIHDLVVVPKIEKNETYFNMEKSLIKKELERVVDFAFMAINKQDTFQVFEDLLDYYNLNLNTINEEIN